jgi:hypothetical protein
MRTRGVDKTIHRWPVPGMTRTGSSRLQIAISLATLILTPISSWLVVRYQLAKNQSYWTEQQRTLRGKELFSIDVTLLERSVGLINRFNDKLLMHHIFINGRDIAAALSDILQTSDPKKAAYFRTEHNDFRKKSAQSFLETRELSIQITELTASATVFFGPLVARSMTEIRLKGDAILDKEMSPKDVESIVRAKYGSNHDLERLSADLSTDLDAKFEQIRPVKETFAFFKIITDAVAQKVALP